MSKPSWVFVVVEDARHRMLLYRYLINCGIGKHEFRISVSPSGRGSAEQWVKSQFVAEVITHRKRQARAGAALIVMIDADKTGVQERKQQLDQALEERGKEPVDANERIARLIPRRNVETWILCLNQQPVNPVNEDKDYTKEHHNWSKLIPPAAETLLEWSRPSNKSKLPDCIPSLQDGVKELKGLRFFD